MSKEIPVAVVTPEEFDLPGVAHFVRLDPSEDGGRINAAIPQPIFENTKRALFKAVDFPARPAVAERIERHFSYHEVRIPCPPALKSLFLVGRPDCDLSNSEDIQKQFRWIELDGMTGIALELGVWHSLQCFPLDADKCRFLFLLDAESEEDFERWRGAPFASAQNELKDLASFKLVLRS